MRSTNSMLALAAGAMITAGCTVGPDYKRPDVRTPDSFHAATQPSQAAVDLTRWWETFSDPTLNELITDAVKTNLDLQLATERVRQARAQLASSRAGLFPFVDVSGSYTRSRSSDNQFSSGPIPGQSGANDLYRAGFDASWEIDVFGGTRRAIESATYSLQAQEEDRRDVLISLLSEVAENYVLLRGYQHEMEITNRNATAQQDTVGLQRAKLAAGIATDLTVAQAEALLNTTRAQIPTLETSIEQTLQRLGVLLDRDPDALRPLLAAPAKIPVGPMHIPPGLPSDLLRRRPDIRRAERNIAAANANIGVATSDLFPRFTLTGSLGLSSARLKSIGDSDSRFWSFGPGVSWRLFDAGQIQANISEQESLTRQALLQYRQTVIQSFSDVEIALTAYDREQARRVSLDGAVVSNRRAVDLARKLYDAGVVDFINVLNAQQSLFEAENQLAQSDQAVSANLVALYKALGGGWETAEEVKEEKPPAP